MIIDSTPSLKLKTLLMAGTVMLVSATASVEAVVVSSKTQAQLLQQEDSPTTGRLIIKYKNSAMQNSMSTMSAQSMQRLSRQAGMQMQHVRQMSSGAQVMQLDATVSRLQMQQLMLNLAKDPNIEYVEPDQLLKPMFVPNDPRFNEQWHYFESAGGLNLPGAWDVATGQGVVVAVLDTGVLPHADLNDNLLPGFDMISDPFIANDGNGRDADATDPGDFAEAGDCGPGTGASASSWHGTHVSGTIAAETNNGRDVAGVAFNAKILPVRVLGRCGGFTSDIADGMIWAAGGNVNGVPRNPNPAKVLNLSLGGSGGCSRTTQNAINIARNLGTTVVVAAGNSNQNAANANPANCNGVVAVAATGRTGGRAFYSNFGGVVDVAAPGGEQNVSRNNGVLSTVNSGRRGPANDALAFFQGTSMATPHVAGVAALLYSLNPSISPDEVENILKNTARGFPARCDQCGTGIVDAAAAVAALDDQEPPPPTGECSPGALDLRLTQDFSNNAPGDVTVSEDGCSITLSGNEWRITDFNINIDAGTTLSFDFSATGNAEIQGVGFDQDLNPSTNRVFQLAGRQNFGLRNFTYTGNGATQSFTIPVGQFFTGNNFGFVIANDEDGGIQNDTVTVSNVVISSEATPTCTVEEGFESGDGGWENLSASSCLTGAFIVGTPTEVSNGGVITQVGGAASGQNAFFTAANSSAGVNDVDGGNCAAISPTYNVVEESTLAISFFHGQRDTGGDNNDFFALQVSIDGGNSFTTVARNLDVRSQAAWQTLNATIPANSNVVIRTQCSDGTNTGDLIECGVDDIRICPR